MNSSKDVTKALALIVFIIVLFYINVFGAVFVRGEWAMPEGKWWQIGLFIISTSACLLKIFIATNPSYKKTTLDDLKFIAELSSALGVYCALAVAFIAYAGVSARELGRAKQEAATARSVRSALLEALQVRDQKIADLLRRVEALETR